MSATVQELFERNFFSAMDYHFSKTMGRISNERNPLVLLGAALASHYTSRGHICVDLETLGGKTVLTEQGQELEGLHWPPFKDWIKALKSSALVSINSDSTPLVLDDRDFLYFQRYWSYQQRLLHCLSLRSQKIEGVVNGQLLREGLKELFPIPDATDKRKLEGIAHQMHASLTALLRNLTIITGGPGTGKTATVVKLLLLLFDQFTGQQKRPEVLLVAPTAKAAVRLRESIQSAKDSFAKQGITCSQEKLDAIPHKALTIHKTLGWMRGTPTRFRYNSDNRLPADIVVVDETSMVDLPLMTKLVEAVPDNARLIFLGDSDQLSSVEPGSVMTDLCQPPSHLEGYSEEFACLLKEYDHFKLPLKVLEGKKTGMWDCLVRLEYSFRFEEARGITELSQAVNKMDSAEAIRLLHDQKYPDITMQSYVSPEDLEEKLKKTVCDGFREYCEEQNISKKLSIFDRFRILCGHRRGPDGAVAVNRIVQDILKKEYNLQTGESLFAGRPIMVLKNDYQMKVFNGDIGIIFPAEENSEQLTAWFYEPGGTVRSIPSSMLPKHETVFAITVHKSQGSGFEHVLVVLPLVPSPVVTKELIYTAITRAKQSVIIFASEESLQKAITSKVERTSGLHTQLWEN